MRPRIRMVCQRAWRTRLLRARCTDPLSFVALCTLRSQFETPAHSRLSTYLAQQGRGRSTCSRGAQANLGTNEPCCSGHAYTAVDACTRGFASANFGTGVGDHSSAEPLWCIEAERTFIGHGQSLARCGEIQGQTVSSPQGSNDPHLAYVAGLNTSRGGEPAASRCREPRSPAGTPGCVARGHW